MVKKMLIALAAAGLSMHAGAASASDIITIGLLSAFTGPFSSFGQLQKEGAVLALEQAKYRVAGKEIKVIYADDQLDNEQAVTKAKQLVEQDKVDVVTGLVSGDEGLSVGSLHEGQEHPGGPDVSASEDMTMREWYPFIVRPTWTGSPADGRLRLLAGQVEGHEEDLHDRGGLLLSLQPGMAASSAASCAAAATR